VQEEMQRQGHQWPRDNRELAGAIRGSGRVVNSHARFMGWSGPLDSLQSFAAVAVNISCDSSAPAVLEGVPATDLLTTRSLLLLLAAMSGVAPCTGTCTSTDSRRLAETSNASRRGRNKTILHASMRYALGTYVPCQRNGG
jgi:hypothetical protein